MPEPVPAVGPDAEARGETELGDAAAALGAGDAVGKGDAVAALGAGDAFAAPSAGDAFAAPSAGDAVAALSVGDVPANRVALPPLVMPHLLDPRRGPPADGATGGLPLPAGGLPLPWPAPAQPPLRSAGHSATAAARPGPVAALSRLRGASRSRIPMGCRRAGVVSSLIMDPTPCLLPMPRLLAMARGAPMPRLPVALPYSVLPRPQASSAAPRAVATVMLAVR